MADELEEDFGFQSFLSFGVLDKGLHASHEKGEIKITCNTSF